MRYYDIVWSRREDDLRFGGRGDVDLLRWARWAGHHATDALGPPDARGTRITSMRPLPLSGDDVRRRVSAEVACELDRLPARSDRSAGEIEEVFLACPVGKLLPTLPEELLSLRRTDPCRPTRIQRRSFDVSIQAGRRSSSSCCSSAVVCAVPRSHADANVTVRSGLCCVLVAEACFTKALKSFTW